MIIPTTFCHSTAASDPSGGTIKKEHLEYYKKIFERYQKTVTKNDRLCRLAQPKYVAEHRPIDSSNCEKNRKVNIVDTSYKVGTRTEQLAYPSVRKLTDLRECPAYRRYCRKRKENVNRMLRKSFLSLYSRLSNLAPPFIEAEMHKFTPEELLKQRKSDKRLSRPFRRIKHAKPRTDESPIPKRAPDLDRIRELAQPRIWKKEATPEEWHLKTNLKYFMPTERLNKLARPITRSNIMSNVELSKSAPSTFPDIDNIIRLAMPKRINTRVPASSFAFPVSKSAQRAKPSARVTELATPRDYVDIHIRKSPFKVKRLALQAKATERIIELAKPKRRNRY